MLELLGGLIIGFLGGMIFYKGVLRFRGEE